MNNSEFDLLCQLPVIENVLNAVLIILLVTTSNLTNLVERGKVYFSHEVYRAVGYLKLER